MSSTLPLQTRRERGGHQIVFTQRRSRSNRSFVRTGAPLRGAVATMKRSAGSACIARAGKGTAPGVSPG